MTDPSDENCVFSIEFMAILQEITRNATLNPIQRQEIFLKLHIEAKWCLFRKNVPQTTIEAFLKAIECKSEWYLTKALALWDVRMPHHSLHVAEHTITIMANDEATSLTWGDFFIFPHVREGMTSEMIKLREFFMSHVLITHKLHDSNLEIFKGVSLDAFALGKVRDDMDPEILLQVEIECLLFWLFKMDKIYDFESDELDFQSGANRAVLNIL